MKILIIGPSWVGDMVMAQTLFIALKDQHADCIIDVLAPDWSRPLLERMPEVRKAVCLPLGHGALQLRVRRRLGKGLQHEAYDQAIVLPNSFKSALIPAWASIPKRTGWRGEMRFGLLNDIRRLDKAAYPLMVDRFVALAYPPAAPLPDPHPKPSLIVNPDNVRTAMDKFGLDHDRPVLSLCPGAEFGESKRWPESYYARVAADRIQAGWQVWLYGSKNDVEVTERIAEEVESACGTSPVNLAGRTELADAVDLLSVSDAVVSNDSGLMHIAAALNRPLVVVYGSTSPDFTPPLNDHKAIVRLGLECSPCFERTCPLGHTNCMKQLGPEYVLKGLAEVSEAVGEP